MNSSPSAFVIIAETQVSGSQTPTSRQTNGAAAQPPVLRLHPGPAQPVTPPFFLQQQCHATVADVQPHCLACATSRAARKLQAHPYAAAAVLPPAAASAGRWGQGCCRRPGLRVDKPAGRLHCCSRDAVIRAQVQRELRGPEEAVPSAVLTALAKRTMHNYSLQKRGENAVHILSGQNVLCCASPQPQRANPPSHQKAKLSLRLAELEKKQKSRPCAPQLSHHPAESPRRCQLARKSQTLRSRRSANSAGDANFFPSLWGGGREGFFSTLAAQREQAFPVGGRACFCCHHREYPPALLKPTLACAQSRSHQSFIPVEPRARTISLHTPRQQFAR